MAKPYGSNEIEDVVSSVRRLVSPEARPRPVSRDLGMDKLLLTPSLRVVPEEERRTEPLVLSVRAPEAEGSVDGNAGAGVALAEQPAGLTAASMPVVESEWEDAFWSEPEPALAELALEAEEAELVVADAAMAEDDLPGDPVADWPDAKAEAAEILPFPQSAVQGQEAPSTLPELTDADGNPVTVLDESALYDIVRTLIREELQGPLGERITSNVRKLVRAEINRALTARSLD